MHNPPNLLIRADASTSIGSGHVLRMIALAQAWTKRGGRVSLVAEACPDFLAARLAAENVTLHRLPLWGSPTKPTRNKLLVDAVATLQLAEEISAAVIVIDGYPFDLEYQQQLKRSEIPLLVVDDHRFHEKFDCDFLLNQNLGVTRADYVSISANTQVLAGAKFVLLREEFLVDDPVRSWLTPAKNLLVSLGGSDPHNVTAKVLSALLNMDADSMAVRVLIGGSNPHLAALQKIAADLSNVQLLHNVTDMVNQYRWADLALVAGGSTNWELCRFGVPRAVVVLAENQRRIVQALAENELAIDLGNADDVSAAAITSAITRLMEDGDLRARQSERGKALIDGLGASRVAEVLWSAIS